MQDNECVICGKSSSFTYVCELFEIDLCGKHFQMAVDDRWDELTELLEKKEAVDYG